MPSERARVSASYLALVLLVALGTFWAFDRGAPDFQVFYHAWKLVLSGAGLSIYRDSPDRFLYAPGFAWLLSPLGLLPPGIALGLWCFAKTAALGYVISRMSAALDPSRPTRALGWCALGALLLARPLLIDFQYGQVNLLILAACFWALFRHFALPRASSVDVAAWALLAIAAVAKVFPLPLLLLPLFHRAVSRTKRNREIEGIFLGLLLVIGVPFLLLGPESALELHRHWREALADKGLPLESHNQSFAALLRHYFSDQPTHVISWGMIHEKIGLYPLAVATLESLSIAWTLIWAGLLLGWISFASRVRAPLEWITVAIGLLIVPSHLVWKPYFLFGFPAAAFLVKRASLSGSRWAIAGLAAAFALVNLTTFDFIGVRAAGYLEAGALLLWVHLALIGAVYARGARV